MLETRYIPQENADKILQVLGKAQELCPNVVFDVIESVDAELLYKGKDKEKAVDEMDGVDGDFGVNCYDGEKVIGWFFFTPYESEDCVVCDYTDNEFCNQCVGEKGYAGRGID